MTKSELKTGMIVTRRDGKRLTVYRNCACSFVGSIHHNVFVDASDKTWHTMDNYSEDLINIKGYPEFDIVRVETVRHPFDYNRYPFDAEICDTIWIRADHKKKMTVAEIEKILGYKVEIISEK